MKKDNTYTIIVKESEVSNPMIDAIVDVHLYTYYTAEQVFAELANIQDEHESNGKYYDYYVYENNILYYSFERSPIPTITLS